MKKTRIFYGYWIVAAFFLFNVVGVGCGPIAFSLFVAPLQNDLGWSRTEIMAAFTILLMCIAIMAPFVGRMVDRHGARMIISLGAWLVGIGLALLSQMNSLWQFYVGYAVLGIGVTAISQVTSTFVVSQWFSRRRGTAIGITSMGIGLGGIIYAPFVAIYLIPNFGWSHAYLAMGVIVVVIVFPLSLLVIRTRPADLGLFPDGAEAPETTSLTESSPPAARGLSLKMALATPAFWLIAAAIFLQHNHMGILQNQVPHLGDIGFPLPIAASVLSIGAGIGTAGMFFFGWLCDKIQAKFAFFIGLFFIAVGISIFINIKAQSPVWMIWLYAAILGFGTGSWLPTLSMLTSTSFGLAAYGAIFGTLSFFQSFGAAIGPLIAGYLYDSMNTYHWAFIIILGMTVLAMPLILSVRRPEFHPTLYE